MIRLRILKVKKGILRSRDIESRRGNDPFEDTESDKRLLQSVDNSRRRGDDPIDDTESYPDALCDQTAVTRRGRYDRGVGIRHVDNTYRSAGTTSREGA